MGPRVCGEGKRIIRFGVLVGQQGVVPEAAKALGVREVGDGVARSALGEHVVFPVAPDRPGGIAGVARIIFAYDLVVERAVAVVAITVDHVGDVAAVHERVVVEVALGMDLVVADREGRSVEVADGADTW